MSSPAPDKPRFVIVPHRPHARVLLAVAAVLRLVFKLGTAGNIFYRQCEYRFCGVETNLAELVKNPVLDFVREFR